MEFKNEFLGLANATWTGVGPEDVVARLESCPDAKAPSRFVAPMSEGIVFVLYDKHEVRRAVISWQDICSVDFDADEERPVQRNTTGFGSRSMYIDLWGTQNIQVNGEWLQMAPLSESFFEQELERHKRQAGYRFEDIKKSLSHEQYLNLVRDVKRGKEIVATLHNLSLGLDTDYWNEPLFLEAATGFYCKNKEKCDLSDHATLFDLEDSYFQDIARECGRVNNGSGDGCYKARLLDDLISLISSMNKLEENPYSAYAEYSLRLARGRKDDIMCRRERLKQVLQPEVVKNCEVIACAENGIQLTAGALSDICGKMQSFRNPDGEKRQSSSTMLVFNADDLIAYSESGADGGSCVTCKSTFKNGEIFIRHPCSFNDYLPVEGYSEETFMAKYYELIRLLRSLGAFTISGSTSYSESDKESEARARTVSGGMTASAVDGEASLKSERSNEFAVSLMREVEQTIHAVPTGKPFIPDNLVFYDREPKWQELARRVLDGTETYCKMKLTCKDTQSLDKKKCDSIDASLKLFSVSLKGSWQESLQRSSEHMKETVVTIEANFRDANGYRAGDYQNVNMEDLSPDERAFLEYVRPLLRNKDVQLADREASIDQKADKLGIDPLRATQLQNMAARMIG